MKILYAFAGLFIFGSIGCNTIRTTFLKQNECGQIVKEPTHFKRGLPVMLEVPTHVDVRIVQTDYWEVDDNGNDPKKLVHLSEATSRSVDIEQIFTEQMFLLDPKRPAEGTGQFKFGFNKLDATGKGKDNGTLNSVQYRAEDKTLTATADLLTTTLNTFSTPGLKRTSINSETSNMITNTRTIALKRFPVGKEHEEEISAFIEQYINGCVDSSCFGSTSYAPAKPN